MELETRKRPQSDEYAPYYERYVRLVPDGDILETLALQARTTRALLAGLGPDKAGYRYAPDKWSVRDVLGHVTDAERVFTYRALCFARGGVEQPGFEENDYARAAGCERFTLDELLTDFHAVREASLALFRRFDAAAWNRRGVANGQGISVRALAWLVAAHELHHVAVLRERYLA